MRIFLLVALTLVINELNAQFTCSTVDISPEAKVTKVGQGTSTLLMSEFLYDDLKAYYNNIKVYEKSRVWKRGNTEIGRGKDILVSPTTKTRYSVEITYDLVQTPNSFTVSRANNCKVGLAFDVEPRIPPTANAGPDKRLVCYGESTQLNGSATGMSPPFSYRWTPSSGLSSTTIANPIATPIATTTYNLSVTDKNGLIGYDQVVVFVPSDDPTPDILGSSLVYEPCPNSNNRYSYSLNSIPINAASFSWQTNHGSITSYTYSGNRIVGIEVTLGVTPAVFSARSSGNSVNFISPENLIITCTATYSCGQKIGVKSSELRQSSCAIKPKPIANPPIQESLLREDAEDAIQIFPNPSTGKVTVSYTITAPTDVNVVVYDLSGRVVTQKSLGQKTAGSYENELLISEKPGQYLLQVQTDFKKEVVKVIIID